MKKQILSLFGALLVAASLTACGAGSTENNSQPNAQAQAGSYENPQVSTAVVHNKNGNPHKILVAYFTYPENTDAKSIHSSKYDIMTSASLKVKDGKAMGNNGIIARYIADKTGADLFSILRDPDYPADYEEANQQGKDEISQHKLPALKGQAGDLSGYDTIILIYPNWWSTLPAPVQTFLKKTDMSGKNVYAIVTSGGSGFVKTVQTIQEAEPKAKVQEGFALNSSDMDKAEETTQQWLDKMGY